MKHGNLVDTDLTWTFRQPLKLDWNPKEDITTFELAQCIPFIFGFRTVYPNMVDLTESHFRHFDITDPNQK